MNRINYTIFVYISLKHNYLDCIDKVFQENTIFRLQVFKNE
jgi:hypothetical protein